MSPYTADETALRKRELRPPFLLAPLLPIIMAISMLMSHQTDLWFCIVLGAIIVATGSFMRLVWQNARYKDFEASFEHRLLCLLTLSSVPVVVLAVVLHFLL